MTFLPDLCPYPYSNSDSEVLCVGWLDQEKPYPTGDSTTEFKKALACCVNYPILLCRGIHLCNFCRTSINTPYDFEGRPIRGGNGEIHVSGSDGTVFAAPTLVLHYVTEHQYLPPKPFVEAVIETGGQLYVVRGAILESIKGMPIFDRFVICLDTFYLANPRLNQSAKFQILKEFERVITTPLESSEREQFRNLLQTFQPERKKISDFETNIDFRDFQYSLWYCLLWFANYPKAQGDHESESLVINRTVRSLEIAYRIGISPERLEQIVIRIQNR